MSILSPELHPVPRTPPPLPPIPPAPPVKVVAHGSVRLAIAHDAAFQFYYQDLFDALDQRGVELVFFSPLEDKELPANCNGPYLGGGYPEEHAEQLSNNHTMLNSVREFYDSGRPVYAECCGLMYLSQGLHEEEKNWPFVGFCQAGPGCVSDASVLGIWK